MQNVKSAVYVEVRGRGGGSGIARPARQSSPIDRAALEQVRVCKVHHLECDEVGLNVRCPAGHLLEEHEVDRKAGHYTTDWFTAPRGLYPRDGWPAPTPATGPKEGSEMVEKKPKAGRVRQRKFTGRRGALCFLKLDFTGRVYRVVVDHLKAGAKKKNPARLGILGEETRNEADAVAMYEKAARTLEASGWIAARAGKAPQTITLGDLPKP